MKSKWKAKRENKGKEREICIGQGLLNHVLDHAWLENKRT
jgi:hypothetical protein